MNIRLITGKSVNLDYKRPVPREQVSESVLYSTFSKKVGII